MIISVMGVPERFQQWLLDATAVKTEAEVPEAEVPEPEPEAPVEEEGEPVETH